MNGKLIVVTSRREIEICKAVKNAGGHALFVGGCVRDHLLGHIPKDFDIEVFGLEPDTLLSLLGPDVKFCGESFGVYKIGNTIDVSQPRRERKVGIGHTGFEVDVDPYMSIPDAASRRDFTINAIYHDPLENKYYDPFDGMSHLSSRRLEVISDRFDEDSLRVLRGMQLVGRFNLSVSNRTIFRSKKLKAAFRELAKERVYEEWEKWATKSTVPSAGLKFLVDCEWVEHFPELQQMIGCQQSPKYHPEGDVWTHTLHVCDAMAGLGGDRIDLFSALLHDCGKPQTTKVYEDGKITSYGHAELGCVMVKNFFEKYFKGYFNKELNQICQIVNLHMYRPQPEGNYKAKSVRKFVLKKLGCASLDQFEKIIRADHYGRPPLPKVIPNDLERFIKDCREYNPPLIRGQDLIDLGYEEGPAIGRKLEELMTSHIHFGYDRKKLLELCRRKNGAKLL